VQQAGKPLLIRGSFDAGELRLLLDALEPRGLFLNIMVESVGQIEALRLVLGL
jgi:hypothetical protein